MTQQAEDLPIAITLGDPAGVGPEVAAKVIARRCVDGARDKSGERDWLLVGPRWALELGAEIAGVTLPPIPSGKIDTALGLGLQEVSAAKPDNFELGVIQAECGRAAVLAVEWTGQAALQGKVAAMVTCPLNKAAIHAAGYVDDLGHQEILARLTGAQWTATLLMTPGLKVAHLSTHKSLIEAARYVTRDTVLEKLSLLHNTLSGWGLEAPRIAVAALNPHGGEEGLLGREEIEALTPAVTAAKQQGMRVSGPIPADSVFNRAIDGEFDVVLALYHDQGHIAIKVHNFHESTTATMGIPFVRTSVDHGTAFDIAGAGVADPQGLEAAIAVAEQICAGQLR